MRVLYVGELVWEFVYGRISMEDLCVGELVWEFCMWEN